MVRTSATRRRHAAVPGALLGETLPEPSKAPTVGEHADAVLGKVLGYDAERIAKLRASGALGGE